MESRVQQPCSADARELPLSGRPAPSPGEHQASRHWAGWFALFFGSFGSLAAYGAGSNLTLGWDSAKGAHIAGYKIYYGQASGQYVSSVAVGNVTHATLSGLAPNTTYYLAATTLDVFGMESAFSSEVMAMTPPQGNYTGLFSDTNGVKVDSSGFFSATFGRQGSFSASLRLRGKQARFSGKFVSGVFSGAARRSGQSALSVQLSLPAPGGAAMVGKISDGTWTADVSASRSVFSRTSPAPQSGKRFTLVIPGNADSANEPGGHSFGALTVSASGVITLRGALGDGARVSQGSVVSAQGQWPLYLSLYRGNGCLLGWLNFTNAPAQDIAGEVSWIRLFGAGTGLYSAGFALRNGVEAIGSAYSPSQGMSFPGGAVLILENGGLPMSITNWSSVAQPQKVTGTNQLSLRMQAPTGLFQGSVLDPQGKRLSFSGVILQKQGAGYGYFLGTTQSGSVYFGPAGN